MVTSCKVLWPRTVSAEAAEEEDALLGSAWRALGLPEDALWAPQEDMPGLVDSN